MRTHMCICSCWECGIVVNPLAVSLLMSFACVFGICLLHGIGGRNCIVHKHRRHGHWCCLFIRVCHADSVVLCLQFPTFRAYPLQPECDTWCEFPVKDRPNAVMQWLMAAEQHPELIQGAWLLMLESDYVWMRPMPVRTAALQGKLVLSGRAAGATTVCDQLVGFPPPCYGAGRAGCTARLLLVC